MALHRYVAEEIALDCQDGLLTRREALRRLGLLGLTAAAASSLLAACAGDDEGAAPSTTASRPAETTTSAARRAVGEEVTFAGPRGQLRGAWAGPASPRGGVLVLHENRG